MGLLQKALLSLRFIGLGGVLRAVRYALLRGRLERRSASRNPPPAPDDLGKLVQAEPFPGGGLFRFALGRLEVRFLAPDIVCLTWAPGTLPVPYALARSEWPEVETAWREGPVGWSLSSEALHVLVQGDGSLSFSDAQGRPLREEHPPRRRGIRWSQRSRLRQQERIYGLGERAAPLNLRPGTYRMWNLDPGGSYGPGTDPLYVCIPVYLGLHQEGSYLVFYENSYPGTFTFGEEAEASFEGGALRYYFIPGSPAHALERYTALTGRPALPPLWALGYHQCRWGYETAQDVREVVAGFQEHDLPLSAVHLDIDYMQGYRVFTVDRSRFPDLAGLARKLLERDIHLVTILDPGVKRDHDYAVFREGLSARVFCSIRGDRPFFAPVWPGWCAFPDFSDPRVRTWWGKHYARLLEMDIAGFWHDMNEPATFTAWGEPTLPQVVCHALEGEGGGHRQVHNLYGLLMNRAGFEALRKHRPDRRPFILSRSGWAGLQRYAWNWTGDTDSTWASLRQTIATVLGLGLCGVPYSGPDIGGFSGDPSAELYLRWFQLSTFLPFFRTHSARGTSRREPWVFGQPYLDIARQFLQWRYRLLPYLYTLAWESSQTGHPLARPLFWPDASDPSLWDVQDAFLLGDSLLVAPVLEEGARTCQLTLPAGRWYGLWDDEQHTGPGTVSLEVSLERIPVLVRAGSILPLGEDGRLVLHLYPTPGVEATGLLYSDAGNGYSSGRLDRFHLAWEGSDILVLSWQEELLSGQLAAYRPDRPFLFPYHDLAVRVHGVIVERAWVDGKEAPVEGNLLAAATPLSQVRMQLADR